MDRAQLIDYLRKSVKLKDPDIEGDEAYKFSDDELYSILQVSASTHNSDYDIETLPVNEIPFMMLLAKREIYYRLASASAPFYPLKAEGAELKKDERFVHYYKLIGLVNAEYTSLWAKFQMQQTAIGGDLLLASKWYTQRNYDLSLIPQVSINLDLISDSSVEISWNKAQIIPGNMFRHYAVAISKTPIYDKYTDTIDSGVKITEISNIHRVCFRFTDLEPSTGYNILVKHEMLNGVFGFSQISFNTTGII